MSKIRNFYECAKAKKYLRTIDNPSFDRTHIGYGSRIIIVGTTNAGKTNALLNFIAESPDSFKGIIIVNRGQKEPLYEMLEDELGKTGSVDFFTIQNLPLPEEINASMEDPINDHYLVVFDDLVADMKGDKKVAKKVENFCIYGRKANLTMVVLTQSWYDTPGLIRKQVSHCLLMNVANKGDFGRIANDFGNLGASKNQIRDMYRYCMKTPLNWLKLDLKTRFDNEKFSSGWTDFFGVERAYDINGDDILILSPPGAKKRSRLDVDEGTGHSEEEEQKEEESEQPSKQART